MRKTTLRHLALFGTSLVLAFTVGCASKPPQTESGDGANVEGSSGDLPVISDKAIGADQAGSDGGNIPGLNTVYFEYDKASLSSETRQKLAENADWIKKNTQFTVQIEGHTDERGSVEYNLSLGERRAKSVKNYLESLGVEGRRMTIISYGEEKPLVPGDSESAWSKNRRANFVPLR